MFGDMMGMMGKLKEAQENAEEVKKRLDTVFVTGESPDGQARVVLTANKEIKDPVRFLRWAAAMVFRVLTIFP